MSPRKAVEQELSKDMILEAARGLFVSEGYDHVSMRKIAKELTCSHGAIYYHFVNKAELFYAIVANGFALLNEKLDKVMQMNLSNREKLNEIFLEFIRFGIDHPSHYETMFLTKDQELKSFLQKEPNESFEKFAQAVTQLSSRELAVHEVWSIFLSLHGFVAHFCFKGQCFDDLRCMADAHCEFILKQC
ncbi:TetR/AcrR family transcriptional regulator [Bacillus weihaiensis]|uniref:TetR/AcrR family transcriptional regulator n=1 Tax=Bacillus weihaiensis TaxID=1547283 RepID=UPI002354FFA9|nr:TetR/AcrR family transcriptional regulator [Bacillus weihaiensis]